MPNKIPASLEATPNIPWREQTLEQLREERDYWQSKLDEADGWGAAVAAAGEFRDACDSWIKRRESEARYGH